MKWLILVLLMSGVSSAAWAEQKKGKPVREKKAEGTEGTQAPDRFEANTVIKSQYQQHGEPLEVDPD